MFEFVYKDDILMWEALIWKRVAVDKKTIIMHGPVHVTHARVLRLREYRLSDIPP
jgi:hypothetical protein